MTQPIQEPSDSRKFSKLTYGQDQLYRRPAPPTGGAEPGIWGYLAWFDGMVLTGGDFDSLANYDEGFLSTEAETGGWLAPANPNNQFSMTFEELGDGAVWVVEVRAQFFEDAGPGIAAGDFVGIGNLALVGASINNEDVHGFQPANLIIEEADDNTFSVFATRVVTAQHAVPFYVTATFGAFCPSTTDVFLNQAELVIWRTAPGEGSFFT